MDYQIFEAIIENGLLKPLTPIKLKSPIKVLVVVLEENQTELKKNDTIFDIDDLMVETGISDLAINHDHYLYGKEKNCN